MIYPDEQMLYAPVEWQDCSEGYTDIRYHKSADGIAKITINRCLLYTSPSPRDRTRSRMPSSA